MIQDFDGSILFVGAGKMGGAVLAGLLEEGLDPNCVTVQDPNPPKENEELLEKYDIKAVPDIPADLAPSVIVIAVKPQIMDQVLPRLASHVGGETIVLSIAAGKTMGNIANHIGSDKSIVRAMPNTPAEIGRAMTVLCANANTSLEQKELVGNLMSAVGDIAWTENESDMDAVTALSGSGPAYLFWLTECLSLAGVEAGLSEDLAKQLARSTVTGAAELMRLSELEPSQLRENVTSPNGTTAAALEVLMADDALKPLIVKAVSAATKRSKELSG